MSLWEDLYRIERSHDESFEEASPIDELSPRRSSRKPDGPPPPPPPPGEEEEPDEEPLNDDSKPKPEDDPFYRGEGEGLRGGSDPDIGKPDPDIAESWEKRDAEQAAREAQQKTQSPPNQYNQSVSYGVSGQPPPKIDSITEPGIEFGELAGAMANYDENWASVQM